MIKNKYLALLFGLLLILCLLSAFLNRETVDVFYVEEAAVYEPLTEAEPLAQTENDEEPSVYDLTGYIYKNSNAYMERLKSEVNDLANDTCDKEHLYEVANSIRLNQISYYTMLNGRYEEGDFDLVEACKSYAFNVEAMAANIMRFIDDGRTKYISRAMLCISADGQLAEGFSAAQSAYAASFEEAAAEE